MEPKRVLPLLHVRAGRVVDPPGDGSDQPVDWASRLEAAGADGILFREDDPGMADEASRAAWIHAVARRIGVPFALEVALPGWRDLEAVLAAGADQVILPADCAGLLAEAARRFDRTRVGVAVDLRGEPEPPLDERAERDWAGAGEILLRPGPGAGSGWIAGAAGLDRPILVQLDEGDEARAVEALLDGLDGLVHPAGSRSPGAWKTLLASRGLPVRI